MKVVINKCYGGFGLSDKAIERYLDLKGLKYTKELDKYSFTNYNVEGHEDWYYREIDRGDPTLIQVVEEMGKDANGDYAKLSIVVVPDGIEWQIEEYDGMEWVAEAHRTWS